MTIQAIPQGGLWYPQLPTVISANPNLLTTSSPTIDAANEAVSFIVQVPKTGNISSIVWRTETVTTGATVDVRAETVDQTTTPASPTGTLLAANTNASQVVADANDNVVFDTTLTAAATVTRGDIIAIVIKNPGASFGNMRIAMFADAGNLGIDFPYAMLFTGTWAAFTSGAPILVLGYSDGTYITPEGCYPYNTITNTSYNTSTTPDSRGARLRFAYGVRISGFYAFIDNDNGCVVKLVNTAYHQVNGTGILASVTIDKDLRQSTGGSAHLYLFSSSVDLDANTYYRLVVEPTSASNIATYDYTQVNSASFTAFSGADFHLTTAKDPTGNGDWTNYDNGTDGYRVPFIGLKLEGVDIPAGSMAVNQGIHAIESGITA